MVTHTHTHTHLHAKDLLSEVSGGCKGLAIDEGEDAEKALPAAEVVVPHNRIVLLSGRVQNVNLTLAALQDHLLAVTVRLRWLVVLDELERRGEEVTRWKDHRPLASTTGRNTSNIHLRRATKAPAA